MKDRLIELLYEKQHQLIATGEPFALESFADYLIDHGVFLPPCEIGNTVWWIDKKRVLDMVCVGFLKTHKKLLVSIARNTNAFTTHYYVEWNVDIFPTKEEAEAKLKE